MLLCLKLVAYHAGVAFVQSNACRERQLSGSQFRDANDGSWLRFLRVAGLLAHLKILGYTALD
jgi:hypothetical protein